MKEDNVNANMKKRTKHVFRMVYMPKKYAFPKAKMKMKSTRNEKEKYQKLINKKEEGCSSSSFT